MNPKKSHVSARSSPSLPVPGAPGWDVPSGENPSGVEEPCRDDRGCPQPGCVPASVSLGLGFQRPLGFQTQRTCYETVCLMFFLAFWIDFFG